MATATRSSIHFGPSILSDLPEDIRARMAAGEPSWFPGLAISLVNDFWAARPATDRASYSTSAWLGEIPPREVLPSSNAGGLSLAPLPSAFKARFTAASADIQSAGPDLVEEAAEYLKPSGAGSAVRHLVRSVHVVASRGPGFDLSHSEPSLPFSILVSLPVGERHAALRLAESLLHEAMHLQLTLIESQAPLVTATEECAYSPWQDTMRPAHGLVHGLYVFRSIWEWAKGLETEDRHDGEVRSYAERRKSEIMAEIMQVTHLPKSRALSPLGQDLTAWLLTAPDHD